MTINGSSVLDKQAGKAESCGAPAVSVGRYPVPRYLRTGSRSVGGNGLLADAIEGGVRAGVSPSINAVTPDALLPLVLVSWTVIIVIEFTCMK